MDALFLNHYDQELAYLRELGGEFATQYPKIAGRLGLDEFSCADPFVERLLEGFAFMAARVQRRLDSEFPQFTRALFDTVFPHYSRPVPSSAIFQFLPDGDSSSLASGYTLKKGTRLHSELAPGQHTACRFDTTSELQLWPIRITETEFFTRDRAVGYPLPRQFHEQGMRTGLKLTIETTGGLPLKSLKMDRLRVHLRGGEIAQALYENLVGHTRLIAASGGNSGNSWSFLNPCNLAACGFAAEDALLPQDSRSFSGYRLLQEYFMLPEKFMFVDLQGLQPIIAQSEGTRLKLVLGFDCGDTMLSGRVSQEHLALHCVPAVNLFIRRADRVHLDHTQHEHHLVVDRSRPLDYEVWSLIDVTGHATRSNAEIPYLPLYAPPASDSERQRHAMYFTAERRTRLLMNNASKGRRSTYPGTEIFLTMTDSHQEPFRHQVQQLSATAYCTNRDLALLPPDQGWREGFSVESGGPIAKVLCVSGPTPPKPPLVGELGDTAWRLVSHLTPNYLSLQDNAAGGAAMLREMLQLYCSPDDLSSLRQIEGLLNIRTEPVVRRLPFPGPLTHGHGISIELNCNEDAFEGGGVFLLGSVLEHFFARYTSLNSFTETSLKTVQRGPVYRWPVRLGESPLI